MSEPIRSGRRWGRLALIAASPFLLFGAGELVMRAIHTHDPASLPAAMAPGAPAGEDAEGELPVFQNVKELSTPSVRGVFRGHVHRTDAFGFRGPERSAEPAPGTRRVLVTGDSIAMGSGVDETVAFPAAAEIWLNHEAAPPRWEVVNTALAGANLSTALGRLEKGIEAYGGDVLVYPFAPNDIEGAHYQRFPADRTALDLVQEAGWPARSNSALIRVATWEYLDLWERIWQLNLDHYSHEIDFNYFENPKAWGMFVLGLDRLARLGETHGRCVVVLMQTRLVALDSEAHPFTPIYDKVAKAARARGLHVIETALVFFEMDARTIRHSDLDPHPNVEGHAVLGRLLGEGVAALPATCFASDGA